MLKTFAIALLILSLPAAAQAASECRGKKTFKLSDGATWCLIYKGETTVTNTLSRDDGQSKSKSTDMPVFVVAMDGTFKKSMGKSEKRMKEICQRLQVTNADAFTGGKRARVVVSMLWPEKARAEGKKATARFANQAGSVNTTCRSVRLFGNRTL